MTDEQIEKALKICGEESAEQCETCPMEQGYKDDCRCGSVLAKRALAYINKLKAENKALMKEADENAALAMEQKLRADKLETKLQAKMKHCGSYFSNEQECLKALLGLHNNGKPIDCDPMYFKGNFYKNEVIEPKLKFDINPQTDGVVFGNATNLPIKDEALNCMILDPPFLFEKRKREQKNYVSRTHTMFHNGWEELVSCYKGILKEAHPVLS